MPNPPYISGHYTPMADETTLRGLTVHGTLPPELNGRYFRNGHNPVPGTVPVHWFKGSGMIHGLRLRDGRAEWYRNRWVRTPLLEGAPAMRGDGRPDLTASVAGTHVIEHAGRILALQEANLPFEMTPELETIGPYDFGGKLATAMTAHPKQDPVTGELLFFSYSPVPPYLTYYTASPEGDITRCVEVEGAGPTLKHDFAITRNHVVWLDMSVVFDPAHPGLPFSWSDTYTPRIGVMPRTGPARAVWYGVEPGVLMHVSNAYEDDAGRVVVEGPRFDRSAWETSGKWWSGAPGHPSVPVAGSVQYRWTLDPASGRASEELVDDLVTDFPTINEDRVGVRNRYSFAVGFPGAGMEGNALVKYDSVTGARQVAPMGNGRAPGEAVFVPAEGATAEDDGYLLTIVSDLGRSASELVVLDASDVTAAALARIELPHHVPLGIHGSWIPEADEAADPGA